MPSKNNFICKRCGDCCKVFKLPVKNKKELIKNFEKHFGFKLLSYDIEILFYGDCEYLQNNRCTIYDKKPTQCEKYYCQRFVLNEYAPGQFYKKRCRVCHHMRTFMSGTERDVQSICGNCWNWQAIPSA